jgi:hypothetical protein
LKIFPEGEWEEYQKCFNPILQKLDSELWKVPMKMESFGFFYTDEEIDANSQMTLKKHPRRSWKGPAGERPPSPLQVVELLATEGPESLQSKFCISICRHSEFPNLLLLSNNCFSPKGHPISVQSHGLILDEEDHFKVIAAGPHKFYDLLPTDPDPDWKSFKVYEKIDGYFAMLYFYRDRWHVSTTS